MEDNDEIWFHSYKLCSIVCVYRGCTAAAAAAAAVYRLRAKNEAQMTE